MAHIICEIKWCTWCGMWLWLSVRSMRPQNIQFVNVLSWSVFMCTAHFMTSTWPFPPNDRSMWHYVTQSRTWKSSGQCRTALTEWLVTGAADDNITYILKSSRLTSLISQGESHLHDQSTSISACPKDLNTAVEVCFSELRGWTLKEQTRPESSDSLPRPPLMVSPVTLRRWWAAG